MLEYFNNHRGRIKAKIKETIEFLAISYKKSCLAQTIILAIPKVGSVIDRYFTTIVEIEKEFLTKPEYNEEVIKELESQPNSLRAIIMGPYFLHPRWVIDRRSEREERRSFSLPLRIYLEGATPQSKRKVRLIIRNSPRYLEYLIEKKILVKPEEVPILIQEMIRNLDDLLKLGLFSFCSADVGYYENVVITENSCFIYGRKTEVAPIEFFYQSKDPNKIKRESARFDRVFDTNYKGRNNEIAHLKQFIISLEQNLKERLKDKEK